MNENNMKVIPMEELMPLIEQQIKNGQSASLRVKGISMSPFLRDGRDSVCLVSPESRKARVGDIFMFRRQDGSFVMHRICRINKDGTLDFVGDNQINPEKNIKKTQLIAYVPRAVRNGRPINCEKGFWHFAPVLYAKLHLRRPNDAYLLYAICKKILKMLRISF